MSEVVKEDEISDDYEASLTDLIINSKPLINVLTMLADENKEYAKVIVGCIEKHLFKMQGDVKLPTMYLIDSIIKNIGQSYITLFGEKIDKIFTHVFEQVSEQTRAQLFKLRQTWTGIFPAQKLSALDNAVRVVDPAWPMVSAQKPSVPSAPSVPLPPVVSGSSQIKVRSGSTEQASKSVPTSAIDPIKEELFRKQKELLQLKQKKLELEIRQTKAFLHKNGVNYSSSVTTSSTPSSTTVTTVSATPIICTSAPLQETRSNVVDIEFVNKKLESVNKIIERAEKSKMKQSNSKEVQEVINSMKRVMQTIREAVQQNSAPTSKSKSSGSHEIISMLMGKLQHLCEAICDIDNDGVNKNDMDDLSATVPQSNTIKSASIKPTVSSTSAAIPKQQKVPQSPAVSISSSDSHTKGIENNSTLVSASVANVTEDNVNASVISQPSIRINPVSSELINAVQRVRDPRLRKYELHRIKNNSNSDHNKDVKSSSQNNANISDKKTNETTKSIPPSGQTRLRNPTTTSDDTVQSVLKSSQVVVKQKETVDKHSSSEALWKNETVKSLPAIELTKTWSDSSNERKSIKQLKNSTYKKSGMMMNHRKQTDRIRTAEKLKADSENSCITKIDDSKSSDSHTSSGGKTEPNSRDLSFLSNSVLSDKILKSNMSEKARRLAIAKALSVHVKSLSESSGTFDKSAKYSKLRRTKTGKPEVADGSTEVPTDECTASALSSSKRHTCVSPEDASSVPPKKNKLNQYKLTNKKISSEINRSPLMVEENDGNESAGKKRLSDGFENCSEVPAKKNKSESSNMNETSERSRFPISVEDIEDLFDSSNGTQSSQYSNEPQSRNPDGIASPWMKVKETKLDSYMSRYQHQNPRFHSVRGVMMPYRFKEYQSRFSQNNRFHYSNDRGGKSQCGRYPHPVNADKFRYMGHKDKIRLNAEQGRISRSSANFVQTYPHPSSLNKSRTSTSNINTILEKAKEALTCGQMSYEQYSKVMTQVIEMNEMEKLEEARRLEESQLKWHHSSEAKDDSLLRDEVTESDKKVENELMINSEIDASDSSTTSLSTTKDAVTTTAVADSTKFPNGNVLTAVPASQSAEEHNLSTSSSLQTVVSESCTKENFNEFSTTEKVSKNEVNKIEEKYPSADIIKSVENSSNISSNNNNKSDLVMENQNDSDKDRQMNTVKSLMETATEKDDFSNSCSVTEVSETPLTTSIQRTDSLPDKCKETPIVDSQSISAVPFEREVTKDTVSSDSFNDDVKISNNNDGTSVNERKLTECDKITKEECTTDLNVMPAPGITSAEFSSSGISLTVEDSSTDNVANQGYPTNKAVINAESSDSDVVDLGHCANFATIASKEEPDENDRAEQRGKVFDENDTIISKSADISESEMDGSSAVVVSSSNDQTSQHNVPEFAVASGDTDIRRLFAPIRSLSPAEKVTTGDSSSNSSGGNVLPSNSNDQDPIKLFNNPFGIPELSGNDEDSRSSDIANNSSGTKDIDYRHMFFPFAAPPTVSVADNTSSSSRVSPPPPLPAPLALNSDDDSELVQLPPVSSSSNITISESSSGRSSSSRSLISDYDSQDERNDTAQPVMPTNSGNSAASAGNVDAIKIDRKLPSPPLPPSLHIYHHGGSSNSSATSSVTLFPPPPPPTRTNYNIVPSFSAPEIPATNSRMLKVIEEDSIRYMNMNGVPYEVRFYNNLAIVFLDWDDPRELRFYDGIRNVIVDSRYVIPLSLNAPDKEIIIDGVAHRMRLGVPTQEIYVNGKGYSCSYSGIPIMVDFGMRKYTVKLEGPPPSLNIAPSKRLDVVAGKISIIIDAKPQMLFLDAKPQKIHAADFPIIVQFVDNFRRILLNSVPFMANYGENLQSFWFFGKRYYFRLSVLPSHVRPGFSSVQNMIQTRLPSPPPIPPSLCNTVMEKPSSELPVISSSSLGVSQHINRMMKPSEPQDIIPSSGLSTSLDVLMNIMPAPRPPVSSISYNADYAKGTSPPVPSSNVSENNDTVNTADKGSAAASTEASGGNSSLQNILGSLSINELFKKLVASGIVPSSKDSESDEIKDVDFSQPESLKQKQPKLIQTLYSGIQCGSCGLRFSVENTIKYSQHLDWHFRQNRKEKESTRSIHTRKWYYSVEDWIEFEEMENMDDRAQCWFETQQTQVVLDEPKQPTEVSVASGENAENTVCELCQEKFEQFYNEETEEWHFKNAIRVDSVFYHPTCYQGYKEKEEIIVDLEVEDDECVINEMVDKDNEETIDDIDDKQNEEECVITDDVTESPEKDTSTNLDVNLIENENSQAEEIAPGEIKIKEEKPDDYNKTKKRTLSDVEDADHQVSDEEEDDANAESDIEEVQVIEQPIEQIVIQDDVEPNLETLNIEEIIAVQSDEFDKSSGCVQIVDEPSIDTGITSQSVVDITHTPVAYTMDGNMEMDDSPKIVTGGTRIRINIAKPPSASIGVVNSNDVEAIICVEHNDKTDCSNENSAEESMSSTQPPPPGVDIYTKPRLFGQDLTEYGIVTKGSDTSSLCTIM